MPSEPRLLPIQIKVPFDKTIGWAFLASYSACVVAAAGEPSLLAQCLAFLGIVIAFVHAVAVYGWRLAAIFLALCLVITFAMENLSIATGFPFGRYHFEVAPLLPHIGAVPLIVGPLYFAMGYFSWIIASILLGDRQSAGQGGQAFFLLAMPIVAAFVMVQWDVVMDPPNATLGHAWIWHDGGGYFGVPLSNFLGWYLTVWLFFQAFALVLWRADELGKKVRWGLAVAVVVLYASVALSLMTPYFTAPMSDVVVAGTHWNGHDLRETSVIVALFTMVFTAVLAFLRLIAAPLRTAD